MLTMGIESSPCDACYDDIHVTMRSYGIFLRFVLRLLSLSYLKLFTEPKMFSARIRYLCKCHNVF